MRISDWSSDVCSSDLFGQNSTGGAINYIAAKPTDTLKTGFDLSFGRFNELVVGGFVSGPITDTVRARLAMRSETMDGWQQSLSRPGDTLGNKRFFTGRLLVAWDAKIGRASGRERVCPYV